MAGLSYYKVQFYFRSSAALEKSCSRAKMALFVLSGQDKESFACFLYL